MGIFFWILAGPPLLITILLVALALGWTKIKPLILQKVSEIAGKKASENLGGAPCDVGAIDFTLGSKTSFTVSNTTIYNLPGFKSEHLVKLGKISVEVDVAFAILSAIKAKGKPKAIEVTAIGLEALHIMYEKNLLSSNVNALLNELSSEDHDEDKKEEKKKVEDKPKSEGGGMQIGIRKVNIIGIEFEWATSVGEQLGVPGALVRVGDMKYDDFTKQFGEKKLQVIIHILIKSIFQTILANVTNFGGSVADGAGKVAGAVGAVGGAVAGKAGDVAHLAGDHVKDVGGAVVGKVGDVAGAAGDHVKDVGGAVVGKVGDAAGAAGDTVKDVGGAVVGKVGDVAGAAGDTVKDVGGAVVGKVGDVAGAAGDTVKDVGGAVVGKVGDVAGTAGDTVKDVGGAVVGKVGDVAGAAGDKVKDVGGAVVGTVGDVAGAAGEKAEEARKKAEEAAQKVKAGLGSLFGR